MISLDIPINASFKKEVRIENLKKINLFFGYNGSGKTTISRVLGKDSKGLVYNEDFIERNFRNIDKQKGIFTIGKDAGDAKDKIKQATVAKEGIQSSIDKLVGNEDLEIKGVITFKEEDLKKNWDTIVEKLWSIKVDTDNSLLLNCIEGLRKDKVKLATKFVNYFLDERRVEITNLSDCKFWDDLDSRAEIVFNDALESKATLNLPSIKHFESVINDPIWDKQIIGNKDNLLYGLIDELKNSDWVNKGRDFLNDKGLCPFCQEPLKRQFLDDLSKYFDEAYQKDKNRILQLTEQFNFASYVESLKELLNEDFSKATELELRITEFQQLLNENSNTIAEKIKNPSQRIQLNSLKFKFDELAVIVVDINSKILAYNKRILERGEEKKKLTKDFWDYYTSYYKDDIENFNKTKASIEEEVKKHYETLASLKADIATQDKIILENQAKLTDIHTSINSINNSLIRNGFTSFKIKKWGEDSCRIVRTDCSTEDNTYMSLSEGEKTIISFLYFIEFCKGTTDKAKEIKDDRIIVIDDPISSLSHNIVFEVAQLIRNEFLILKKQESFSKLFLLTHNLYLFYEIRGNIASVEKKIKESSNIEGDATIKIFNTYRVKKDNDNSSIVLETSRDEILTDYDVYWSIVKDCKDNCGYKAMLPNAMRNILEYYFSFIMDEDNLHIALENIVDKKFVRFIQRNSHSDKENFTFNVEEIDVSSFLNCFEDVFKKTRHYNHYKLKMNI